MFGNYLYYILLLNSGACDTFPIHSGPTWTPPATLAVNPAPTRTQPLNPHNEHCASRSSPAVAMGGTVTVKGIVILFNSIEIMPGTHFCGPGR